MALAAEITCGDCHTMYNDAALLEFPPLQNIKLATDTARITIVLFSTFLLVDDMRHLDYNGQCTWLAWFISITELTAWLQHSWVPFKQEFVYYTLVMPASLFWFFLFNYSSLTTREAIQTTYSVMIVCGFGIMCYLFNAMISWWRDWESEKYIVMVKRRIENSIA